MKYIKKLYNRLNPNYIKPPEQPGMAKVSPLLQSSVIYFSLIIQKRIYRDLFLILVHLVSIDMCEFYYTHSVNDYGNPIAYYSQQSPSKLVSR
jgi:hypothetical protein